MVRDPRMFDMEELCALAHWAAARGWVPATSGNFSLREDATGHIFISPSGLDKGQMTPADLLEVDEDGRALRRAGKPSAEAGLHAVVYRHHHEARAIAHVHTIWNTLLSARFAEVGCVEITGYELLKALSGVETHKHCERVPVIANSQDYDTLARELDEAFDEFPLAHGVLLSAHGLYTWGTSVAEVRRHLEALEFLFEVECRRLMGGIG
ncbi:MAG TPA: methylthioribulose 1-phosphate dehydratase [Terracidiphilus sp.]|jgi:methylthioribulose-1-phosphate dehydratase|nr:methylthioribulose 1-phosphate dehydratase [Terracidiphilus sp.]